MVYRRRASTPYSEEENQVFHDELAAATAKFATAAEPWELLWDILAGHSVPTSCPLEDDRERHFRHVVHQFVREVARRMDRDHKRSLPAD